ncbi:MAG: hypothetical protein ACOVKO_03550 [Elstera sp.]
MTTKHTPGPWQAQDYWIIGCVEDSWDIMAGADTACPWRVAKVFRSEANARLIAAAPEMYEALPDLSHVISWLQNGCDPIKAADELQVYQERIDRAKTKAEGKP